MRLHTPTAAEGAAGLRAMAMVARDAGGIRDAARSLIAGAQRHLLGDEKPIDRLAEITPAELAAAIPRPEIREQLVGGMVVVSLCQGAPPPQQVERVESFAAALGVDGPQLRAIRRLADHDVLLYKLCVIRNGQVPDMIKDLFHARGIAGAARGLLGLRGLVSEPDLAKRFQAWERLPADTLGAHVYHHYRDHGFAFPGEPHGFPETGMYHDFTHVLAGYDITPAGETLVSAFIAGYRESRPDHGLFTALFGLSIFSTGVDVTPIGVGAKVGTVGTIADRFFEAIERGSKVPTDLSDAWDFWEWVELPLAEARTRLGIPPKASTAIGPGDYPF
jgi:hypothetical protein